MSPIDDKKYDTLDEVFEDINNQYTEVIGVVNKFYEESGIGYVGLPEPGSAENTEHFLSKFRNKFDNPEEMEKAYEAWTELTALYKDLAADASVVMINNDIPNLNTVVDDYVGFMRMQMELERKLQGAFGLSTSDVKVNEETDKGEITLQEVIERLE